MDKVRKIAERLWYNKERLVFVIMLGVLSWNVYRVVKPVPPEKLGEHRAPERVQDLPGSADLAALPPRQSADWVAIYTPNPFWYFSGLTTTEGGPKKGSVDAGITLLGIREVRGKYRAQLETESSKKWYDEGESFESYELLKIDPEAGTCQVKSERLGKVITLSLPSK